MASGASPPNPGEQVPRQIPYRGTLELNGLPAPTGPVDMVFALYTTESGGTPAWTEAQSVAVQDGQFTVALGDVNTISPGLFAQPSLYLGISVAGTELAGRQRLLTVPYTQRATSCHEVDSVPHGAVMFFALPACPAGWAEVTNARGRAIVGLPAGGVVRGEPPPSMAGGVGGALEWGARPGTRCQCRTAPCDKGSYLVWDRGADDHLARGAEKRKGMAPRQEGAPARAAR